MDESIFSDADMYMYEIVLTVVFIYLPLILYS